MAPGGAFKDVILAIGIVGLVLGGLFLYTSVWPPMVVVESGSMMHANSCPPPQGQPEVCDRAVGYGRLGFIDPGDMVFVKRAPERPEIATLAEAAARDPNHRNYGKPGDVVVYFNFENVGRDPALREQDKKQRTPIIHRAIAYVEVSGVDRDRCKAGQAPQSGTYSVLWTDQPTLHVFQASRGIYLPDMGFGPPSYREDSGYKPCWSGFITKGDNPVTNVFPDQALGGGTLPSQPVELDWIEGKAVGELPWFGLIKLALSSQPNYQCSVGGTQVHRAHDPACDNGRAVRILNAFAPMDLWVMLGVSLAFIAVAPLGYDMYLLRRQKLRQEAEARGEELPPGPFEQLKQRLAEMLGRGGAAPAGPEEGSDPRDAFEPPPPPPAAQPPAPPPSRPPSATKPGAKFERVKKD